ncbi:MAG: hypothetical protein LUQ11_14590 [Methylococcaceae bacterium]|nr:hypothetical protein [Methylococcaceae bacterium]
MNRYLISTLSCALFLSLTISESNAGEILKCEKRTKPAVSRISVQGEDLTPGAMYTATVSSGNYSAFALTAADVAGVVNVDFNSNPNDILAGKTAINPQFIGSEVDLVITDALGNRVIETSAVCKTK